MKLSKVIIHNFGPYKHQEIDLHENFTVIRGRNLSGKSWIWRAIVWCLLNQVANFENSQHNKNEPSYVTCIFDNGTTIQRYRDKKNNNYILNENETILAGAGPNILVTNLTGIKPIALSENWEIPLSFQGAHDSIFLLGEGDSRRDSAIGRIVGADVLDVAAKLANNKGKALAKEITREQENVKELEKNIAKLEHIELVGEYLNEAEEYEQEAASIRTRIDEARALLLRAKLPKPPSSIDLPKVPEYNSYARTLVELTKVGDPPPNVTLPNLPNTTLLEHLNVAKTNKDLEEGAKESTQEAMSRYTNSKQEFENALKEAGICPLCKRPINEDTCNH